MDSDEADPDRQWRESTGRSVWRTIHTLVYGMKTAVEVHGSTVQAAKNTYRAVVRGIAEIYPCSGCSRHLRDEHTSHFDMLDVLLLTRHTSVVGAVNDMALWAFRFHNSVSAAIGNRNNEGIIRFGVESSDDAILRFLSATYCPPAGEGSMCLA